MINRLDIDEVTRKRLVEAAQGRHGQWKMVVARNILQQGWISIKQRYHIFSEPYPTHRRTVYGRGGYDGPPDNAGNGYVTGE